MRKPLTRVKFVEDDDFAQIRSWYRERNMDAPPISNYPHTGFMVEGVGAGFIYETDSDICLLEGFITNPLASDAERDTALDAITEALLEEADDRGFNKILALTRHAGIKARGLKYSFRDMGTYTLLVQEG